MVCVTVDRVTASICYAIGTGDYLRTSIAIRLHRYKCYYRSSAVVCLVGYHSYIRCRYIADTLNATGAGLLAVGGDIVIYSDSLGNVDLVTASIGYTVGTGDDLRTGIAVGYIT